MFTTQEVLDVVSSDRDYQKANYPVDPNATLAYFLELVRRQAESCEFEQTTDRLRKIACLCVAGMEQFGTVNPGEQT